MTVHEKAASGFSRAVEVYARGRPDYPTQAVDLVVAALDLSPGKVVVDVGAGTGKFTRLLVASRATVVAIEPIEEMRNRLRADLPGVQVLDGTAEQLPMTDQSADGIVVAQAFHWFDGPRALAEFAR